MPLSFGLGFAVTQARTVDDLVPPEGFAFVVDDEGTFLTDPDGDYLVAEID